MTKLDGKDLNASIIEKLLTEALNFQALAQVEVSRNNLEKAKEYLLKAKSNLVEMDSLSNKQISSKTA